MSRNAIRLLFGVLAALTCAGVMAACANTSTDSAPPPAAAAATVPAPTTAPAPTAAPTATPEPTAMPAPTAAPEPTATPIPESAADADPRQILDAALAATNALDSFQFEMDILLSFKSDDSSIEIPIASSGDYKAPGMIRADLNMDLGFLSIESDLSIESEIVDTGDALFFKDPQTGVWVKEENASDLLANPSSVINPEGLDTSNVTAAGTESMDGVELYVIQAVVPDPTGAGLGDMRYLFWVRTVDNLMARVQVEGGLNLGEGGSGWLGLLDLGLLFPGDVETSITMSLSGYNKDVTIEAPELQSAAPAPQPIPESTAEPISDHTSLFLSMEAMASAQTAHIEGEFAIKESRDAETGLVLQRFSGDGMFGGDNRLTGTIEINTPESIGVVPFEARRVDGVEYSTNDPALGWDITPGGGSTFSNIFGEGIFNNLFDPSIGDPAEMVDPVVTRETLDGEAVFRVDAAVDNPDTPLVRRVLWIGEDDYRLRQFYLEGSQSASDFPGFAPSGSDQVHISLTARYSNYDEPVTITAP